MEDIEGAELPQDTVTGLLRRLDQGDDSARAELFDALYPSLRQQAEFKMRGQPVTHTLQATALVNEVFLKLVRPSNQGYRDRDHFLQVASKAMRHVLVDHARGRATQKREGLREAAELTEVPQHEEDADIRVGDLESALLKLERIDPKMAKAVELRFFAGASVDETSRILGLKRRTFDARWHSTRAWLRQQLDGMENSSE